MINRVAVTLLFLTWTISLRAQNIQSPYEFFGYQPGTQFTPYSGVVAYFKRIASASRNMRMIEYGKTNEGRPLIAAFISSPENISELENIRNNNLKLTGIKEGQGQTTQPAIVWLSYNVHGNEPASTEAAIKTLFALTDPTNNSSREWLKNTLIIIDPCLNPDGRERYINYYMQVKNASPDAAPYSREHQEPWPGGRTNHYYFDLNRDWAWQTQVETQARMRLFNQWLPQVHIDFHEQGIDEPYFFAPAAEPFHEDITPWQREFQALIGKNNARYFDRNGWMYFTRERFDLLYPSYGDTYPIYNGAIGMTYEQGGAGRAGLTVLNSEGDTLTLAQRVEHHFTTGLATIEVVSKNAPKVVTEFREYFRQSARTPPGKYKTYVIKSQSEGRLKALAALLDRNGIRYGYGVSRKAIGLNYFSGRKESFLIDGSDMVIPAYQPKSVLLKVLFEPQTVITDSNTYDITAWALPFAYGLKAYALTSAISAPLPLQVPQRLPRVTDAVAYIARWNCVADVKFVSQLIRQNIKVRYTEVPVEAAGVRFDPGSIVITRAGNEVAGESFGEKLTKLANASGVELHGITSGMLDKGADLGSGKIRLIGRPKVALVFSDDSTPSSLGEVWQFFEQQIEFPVSVIRGSDLAKIPLNEFNVLIFSDGYFADISSDKVTEWIRSGGKLIAMESAVAQLAGKKGFAIRFKDEKKDEKEPYATLKRYESREADFLQKNIPGAIYKVNMDSSHPLAFGIPDYFSLKLNSKVYQFLDNGWNVGIVKKDNYVAGFVGGATKKVVADGLLFGVQHWEKGSVVYLADNPLFRSFWESGKMLFSNAVFFVGQ